MHHIHNFKCNHVKKVKRNRLNFDNVFCLTQYMRRAYDSLGKTEGKRRRG